MSYRCGMMGFEDLLGWWFIGAIENLQAAQFSALKFLMRAISDKEWRLECERLEFKSEVNVRQVYS